MIEIRNLVKRYGDHLAVDHLNLTIDEGRIYGFLGPNGAGKSTTMNIMTGYLSATEGDVIINGHNILEEPEEAKRCIGYLPELPPLYGDMTVGEYLNFCAELKRIPKADRQLQLDKVVQMTKLRSVYDRLIRNLSKGYRQRVGLAQAILGFPPVIILDEPTVGLDPKQIIEIREMIRELAKNHTVILSSHILSEVQAVCDHVVIIHHGKLLADDDIDVLEQQLSGSAQLSLTVKGERYAAEQALEGIEGIARVDAEQNGELTSAMVELAPGADPREQIFFACAGAKLPILEMVIRQTSLEQVFLELTDESATAEAEVAAAEKKKRGLFAARAAAQQDEPAESGDPAQQPEQENESQEESDQ